MCTCVSSVRPTNQCVTCILPVCVQSRSDQCGSGGNVYLCKQCQTHQSVCHLYLTCVCLHVVSHGSGGYVYLCKRCQTHQSVCYLYFTCVCLCVFSRAVISVGVEEEDKKHTWMEDAEAVSRFFFLSSFSYRGYLLSVKRSNCRNSCGCSGSSSSRRRSCR